MAPGLSRSGWVGGKEEGAPSPAARTVFSRPAAEMPPGRSRGRWVGGREEGGPSSLVKIIFPEGL